MAIWCYTDFTVCGPAEDISRFRGTVCGSNNADETAFYFDRLIPMPPNLSGIFANFGTVYDVYYGNAEAIWSSCYAEVTNNRDGSLHVQFDTAWAFAPDFQKTCNGLPDAGL